MNDTTSTSLNALSLQDRTRLRRNVGYGLLVSLFFLGFFHRFSPAALADAIASDLEVNATALGVIVSMNFWIYTLMQLPAGVLVDRFGVRRVAAVGATLTACGVGVLSLAQDMGTAMLGPALVGLGTSSVFSGIMKYNMLWFPARRYAMITGITLLLGTLGSLMAQGPVAALLVWMDWRALLQAVAMVTVLLSATVFMLVRDTPGRLDNEMIQPAAPGPSSWRTLTGRISATISNRQLWKLLVCTAGTNGTYYAFAGLWAIPYLVNQEGMERTTAVAITSASMAAYGIGGLTIGLLSDRMAVRKPFIVACTIIGAGAWMMLAWHPFRSDFVVVALCILLGLSASLVTVSFTAIKESADVGVGATAIAIGNAGVFLVAAVVQALYGVIVDMGLERSEAMEVSTLADGAYGYAMWLPAIVACVGVIAALTVRETYSKDAASCEK